MAQPPLIDLDELPPPCGLGVALVGFGWSLIAVGVLAGAALLERLDRRLRCPS